MRDHAGALSRPLGTDPPRKHGPDAAPAGVEALLASPKDSDEIPIFSNSGIYIPPITETPCRLPPPDKRPEPLAQVLRVIRGERRGTRRVARSGRH